MVNGKKGNGRRNTWIKRILLTFLSIIIALIAGECTVRLFFPQVLFPRYVTAGSGGIRVNIPNVRYFHTSPEARVGFRINSMGIRSDREYTFEKPEGILRIVAVGDSFTQGYEVNVEDSYLYLLEQCLEKKYPGVEVINCAVSGFSTAEELIMLQTFGFNFNPDIVIVGYYQNDLDDNVRTGLFSMGPDGELSRSAETYLPAVKERDFLYSLGIYRWLAENSHLLCLLREQLAYFIKTKDYERNLDDISGDTIKKETARTLLGAKLLDKIKEECNKRNISFFLLDIIDFTFAESNLPAGALKLITEDDIVHTRYPLLSARSSETLYRLKGHLHWTEAGHRIAARLLCDRLLASLSENPDSALKK
ncbi:MAG: hypothetical protein JW881_12335 [Spirochaetales bacterium]|nr:hypothetical protein [Spirochaetales bacterium]